MLYNKFTVVANWKMNPCTYQQAKDLINYYLNIPQINQINLIVAVPHIYLGLLSKEYRSKDIMFSSQNISSEEHGAFTGEISAAMLQDLQLKYSIIGHSECRKHHKESNLMVATKVALAIKFGLSPIVCIGETKTEFNQGELIVKQALMKQLDPIISKIKKISASKKDILIAYEPIWAIGSGLKIQLNYIKQIAMFIAKYIATINNQAINCHIFYGGSVNAENVHKIKKLPRLAGVLVGGASLDPVKFSEIIKLIVH